MMHVLESSRSSSAMMHVQVSAARVKCSKKYMISKNSRKDSRKQVVDRSGSHPIVVLCDAPLSSRIKSQWIVWYFWNMRRQVENESYDIFESWGDSPELERIRNERQVGSNRQVRIVWRQASFFASACKFFESATIYGNEGIPKIYRRWLTTPRSHGRPQRDGCFRQSRIPVPPRKKRR